MTKIDFSLVIGMVIAAPHFSIEYAALTSSVFFGFAIFLAWKGE